MTTARRCPTPPRPARRSAATPARGPRRRPGWVIAALVLVAAACGQKPGVAQLSAGAPAGDVAADGFGSPTGPGAPAAPAGGGAPTGSGGTTGGGGGSGGGAPTGSGGGTPGGGGSAPTTAPGGGAPQPVGDRTGIDDDARVIRIGVHAPVTGAAPIPQSTFEEARDDYWAWLVSATGGVWGTHNVEVFFQDDEFNPNVAVQRCRRMVEQDKVFLLIGGGGADQITACAQYANSVGVPYLSAGVNEDGLANLRGYFALSMSYAQQSPMLAQLAARLPGTRVGIAVSNSPSFADAHESIRAAFAAQGLDIVYDKTVSKSVSAGEGLQIATDMNAAGVEIAYMLMSPTSFITIAQAANGQGYNPQYIGPGITSGLNTVARVGCPAIGEARFLSPFMGLDTVDTYDPNFKANSDGSDDLALALWGLNEAIHRMFEAVGPSMTRQSFVATVEQLQLEPNVFPPLRYSPDNHLGGTGMHLLRADCSSGQYVTEQAFATGF